MKMEIKSWGGQVLYSAEASSFRELIRCAIKDRADLSGANLSGANLSSANLSGADLSGDLLEALKQYRSAQRRILEKWAEGDMRVKQDLWKNLHACESFADAAIAKTQGRAIPPNSTEEKR